MKNEIPAFNTKEYFQRRSRYCLCVFVLNEKGRLQSQLAKMAALQEKIDIIIADGGSTDSGTDENNVAPYGVRAVLTKTGPGALGAQMRMAFAYALEQGYEGVVAVDGNDKDDVVSGIPSFIKALDQGYDHIQGSRFITGGFHQNTPLSRLFAVKVIHAPLISLASGFRYTDTTNGFRGYSKKFLTSERVNLFRNILSGYELHYYLSIKAAQENFKVTELPVTRVYPNSGATPTKISPIRGNLKILQTLFKACSGQYDEGHKYSFWKFLLDVDFKALRQNPWIPFLTVSLTVFSCLLYLMTVNNQLKHFHDRILGAPVLWGIDAGARSFHYFFLVALSCIVGLLSLRLLPSLLKLLKGSRGGRAVKVITWLLFAAVAFGGSRILIKNFEHNSRKDFFVPIGFVVVMGIWSYSYYAVRFLRGKYDKLFQKKWHFSVFKVHLLTISIGFLAFALRAISNPNYRQFSLFIGCGLAIFSSAYYFYKNEEERNKFLTLMGLFSPVGLASYILFSLFSWGEVNFNLITFMSLGAIPYFLALILLPHFNKRPEQIVMLKALFVFSVFSPSLVLFSQEIQFLFSPHLSISTASVFGIAQVLLVSLCFLFFQKIKKSEISTLFNIIGLPAILFTVVMHNGIGVWNYYSESLVLGFGDWFHQGEALMGPFQMSLFNKIPWMDIFPTHGFFDYGPGYIMALFKAGSGFNYIAWQYFSVALFAIGCYYFLLRVSNAVVAVLTIVALLTWNWHFPLPMWPAPALLLALVAECFHTSQSFNKRVLLFLIILFSFFYYPVIGVPVIAATILLEIGIGLYLKEAGTRSRFKAMGVASFLAALIVVIAGTRSKYPLMDILRQWKIFIGVQAQSMSYEQMLNQNLLQAVHNYLLVPGTFIIVFCLSFVAFKNSAWRSRRGYLIAFLSLYFIIEFNRRLQRHALSEFFEPYTFVIFLLIVIWALAFHFLKKSKAQLCCVTIIAVFPLFGGKQPLLQEQYRFAFKNWTAETYESRVVIDPTELETEIVHFLKKNLKENETFFDFSNSPVLYIATGKEFPTFFIPTLYQTSESIQKYTIKDLERLLDSQRLKYIIYERPQDAWGNVDGLANEIRSFRLTEFMYKNYFYCQDLKGYKVWCHRSFDTSSEIEVPPQIFDFKNIPYIWGEFDPYKASQQPLISTQTIKSQLASGQSISIPLKVPAGENAYLHVQACATDMPSLVKVTYNERGDEFTFLVKKCPSKKNFNNYILRLGTELAWFFNRGPVMQISSDHPIYLGDVSFRQTD